MSLTEYLELEKDLQRLKISFDEQRKREQEERRKITIERLDKPQAHAHGNGYRFSDQGIYAFYDVYWNRVSEHYLVQVEYRFKQHNLKLGIKPLNGPYALEILEPETSEEIVDKKCLERIMTEVKRHYRYVNIDVGDSFDRVEIKIDP